MKILKRPTPIHEEIALNPEKTIMSKTDARGVIEYANDYFMEISGYQEHELIGQPHNVIRHPDMPKVIFKWLWKRLLNKENMHAVVKNLSKDGRYYWVITDFEVKVNDKEEVISLFGRRKMPPRATVKIIKELYEKLLAIEQSSGVEVSEKYLIGYLEEKGKTYDEFIEDVCFLKPEKKATPNELQYHKRKNIFNSMFR